MCLFQVVRFVCLHKITLHYLNLKYESHCVKLCNLCTSAVIVFFKYSQLYSGVSAFIHLFRVTHLASAFDVDVTLSFEIVEQIEIEINLKIICIKYEISYYCQLNELESHHTKLIL